MDSDIFGKDIASLKKKKLYLFDMDGTIYLGNSLFPRIAELFSFIKKEGGRVVFITNNSSKSVDDYAKKLHDMGIEADPFDFLTSTQAARHILHKEHDKDKIYAQGTASFVNELKEDGFNITIKKEDNIKAVIVGFDRELTFEKELITCEILTTMDVDYYATNPDWVCPTEFGSVPDCGSMCFGYEKATGKKPYFIGKPNALMIELALKKYSINKEEAVVVGDRIYTDVASGVNAGVDTVLVLSGESDLNTLHSSDIKPTFVLNNITDLLN